MKLHLAAGLLYTGTALAAAGQLGRRAPEGEKKVIVQLFGWNWESVARECREFLGPEGVGYVQVSPPTEHIRGDQWWTDYQPVSYNLVSKRGNREQFKTMIDTCREAGVGVIVDTIFNHMAGIDSGTGVGGSAFEHYRYEGIYQPQDFHYCDLTENNDVEDYTNRTQVQFCELGNLADLATETPYVRQRLSEFASDLLSLGAAGLRLDASKHIPAADIAAILSGISPRPNGDVYITQEVIFGADEPVLPNEYEDNGDVQELRYTTTLKDAFEGRLGGVAGLREFDERGWVDSDRANVFVANHDTERNDASLSFNSPNNAYILASIFSLAHPYGSPTVLSSFSFSSYDDGAPNNGRATCSANGGDSGWRCEHRLPAITNMINFHNAVGDADLVDWTSPSSDRIAFGRGARGFVAINNSPTPWSESFTTSLPAGAYCDAVQGRPALSGSGCSGGARELSVDAQGRLAGVEVPPYGAVAVFVGQGKEVERKASGQDREGNGALGRMRGAGWMEVMGVVVGVLGVFNLL